MSKVVSIQPIIHVRQNRAVTSSLDVANYFGKRHKDVLRAIQNLECSEQFRRRNFAPSSYVNEQGKIQPSFNLTKDGFAMLAFGFTGMPTEKPSSKLMRIGSG